MSIKVSPPPKFWDDATGPQQDFKLWITLYDGYLELQDVGRTDKLTDFHKNNLLLLHLGTEGSKVFQSNPILADIRTKSYAEFSQAVRDTFIVPTNPVRAHYDLFNRRQQPSETVAEFLASLRTLMADCSFCVECNKKMLATMLVVGCNNAATQEKLLTEREIDFTKFFDLLKAEESAREASSHLQSSAHQVNKVARFPFQPKAAKGKVPFSKAPNTKFGQGPACSRCGKSNHPRTICPARNATCHHCGKPGHWAKFCRSALKKGSQADSGQKVCCVYEEAEQVSHVTLAVGSVGTHKSYTCQVTLKVGPDILTYIAVVDSGSDISTIAKSQYERAFKGHSVTPLAPNVKITNYDESPITAITGTFQGQVSFQGRFAELTFYIVPDSYKAVLGKDAMHVLSLMLNPKTYQVSAVSASPVPACVSKYPNLTATGIGKYPNYKHMIKLRPDAVSKVAKLRPVALALRDAVSKEIQSLVDSGIWERCQKGEWLHGLVVVPKPEPGQVRITTDLSPLNKFVIPNHHPMPTAQDLFLRMRGCTLFSRLDLTKAYFHIELDEESRPLTATITHDGVFQYTRLVMGLTDSGNVFQDCVEDTLRGIDKVAASVDDILIGGVSQSDLDARLDQVLKRLSEKDFRINPNKCEFNKKEVTYLGHLISQEGVRPNPRRVKAIQEAPAPKNLKELQSLLGFCNYYCSYVPQLATLCEPLRKLTRKDNPFVWDDSCQSVFSNAKAAIANDALLAIFDPAAPTILATDASNVGIGAMLSQVQNGKEVPIAFASRTLQPAERNYATNEAEALACVWGCEHFDKFLLGRQFELHTDHSALQALLQRFGTTRQAKKFHRWYERLRQFDYTVKYCEGSANAAADMLSRLPIESSQVIEPMAIQTVRTSSEISFPVVVEETGKDQKLSKVREIVKDPNSVVDKQDKALLRPYLLLRHEMYEYKGVVFRRDGQIVLPSALTRKVLELAHEGHPGIARTKRILRETYWWPGFHKDVETFVTRCQPCQLSEKSVAPAPKIESSLPAPGKPWRRLVMDIAGPYAVAPQSKRFITTLICHHSGYPEYKLSGDISSSAMIEFLEEVFSRLGYPEELLTDNGPQFTSDDFKSYLQSKGVKHLLSAVYNPQTNGRVECFNRYLKFGIETFTNPSKFSENVRKLYRSYRATPLHDNGQSPSELLNGRKMRLGFEAVIPEANQPQDKTAHTQPKSAFHSRDKPKPIKPSSRGPYRVGQKVLARRPQVAKGQSPWTQPQKIVEVLGNWTYRLSSGGVWNARKLRKYYESEDAQTAILQFNQLSHYAIQAEFESRLKDTKLHFLGRGGNGMKNTVVKHCHSIFLCMFSKVFLLCS